MLHRVLIMPLSYLSCFILVLRGTHNKIDICQTYIRSQLRLFPYFEVAHVSTTFKLKKGNQPLNVMFFVNFFFHSTVPDNKSDKQKWYMLFFTCINIVVDVLACARAIAHIKWRRLPLSRKGKEKLQIFLTRTFRPIMLKWKSPHSIHLPACPYFSNYDQHKPNKFVMTALNSSYKLLGFCI